MADTLTSGTVQQLADRYRAALLRSEDAAVHQMLAAWSDAYWPIHQEVTELAGKIARARAAGDEVSAAWLYQQRRLQAVLDEVRRQVIRYTVAAARATTLQQTAAVGLAMQDAAEMMNAVVARNLPGLAATFAAIDPAVVTTAVGYLGDGSPILAHLSRTLPGDMVDRIRDTIMRGVIQGKSQDWMLREVTRDLSIAHSRATTILRTESLRIYRETTRQTFVANADVLDTWVWTASLDGRCCVACVVMHGTEHPITATLDGHPRCRCTMIPRTKTWAQLGATGVPETRLPLPEPGAEWLVSQSPAVQRALMGSAKYEAWKAGEVSLEDMVARHTSPVWGTTRGERSLKAIREGRDANYTDS